MKNTPLISVIIPVYKVEPYLRQCLDSVVNQTYRNLEIIVVDDGSPDNCGAICDEYAQKDSRFRVLHKENGGLSAARNDAMELATGKYLSFVDPDDWCELNMYETALERAEQSEADIVIFSAFSNSPSRQIQMHAFGKEFLTTDSDFIKKLQLSAISHKFKPFPSSSKLCQGYPWDKLFKRSMISDNSLRFPENVKANEDIIFNVLTFQFAKKVMFFDVPLYHWRVNPSSIGHKYTKNRVEVDREVYDTLVAIGEKYQLSREYEQAVYVRVISNAIEWGRRCFFHKKREGSFMQKLKDAEEALHSEPFCTAAKNVEKNKLGKLGKAITYWPHPAILYLGMLYLRLAEG